MSIDAQDYPEDNGPEKAYQEELSRYLHAVKVYFGTRWRHVLAHDNAWQGLKIPVAIPENNTTFFAHIHPTFLHLAPPEGAETRLKDPKATLQKLMKRKVGSGESHFAKGAVLSALYYWCIENYAEARSCLGEKERIAMLESLGSFSYDSGSMLLDNTPEDHKKYHEYQMLRLVIALHQQEKREKTGESEEQLKLIHYLVMCLQEAAECSFFMGQLERPFKENAEDFLLRIVRSYPQLGTSVKTILEWLQGKNELDRPTDLIKEEWAPSKPNPKEEKKARHLEKAAHILSMAIEPVSPFEEEAWNDPISYVTKTCASKKDLSIINRSSQQKISPEMQIKLLEAVGKMGFKKWAMSCEPLMGAMLCALPEEEQQWKAIALKLNEFMGLTRKQRGCSLASFMGIDIRKQTEDVQQTFSFCEELWKTKDRMNAELAIFDGELDDRIYRWLLERKDEKIFAFGAGTMKLADFGTAESQTRIMLETDPWTKQLIDLTVSYGVHHAAKRYGWNAEGCVAVPVAENERLVKAIGDESALNDYKIPFLNRYTRNGSLVDGVLCLRSDKDRGDGDELQEPVPSPSESLLPMV